MVITRFLLAVTLVLPALTARADSSGGTGDQVPRRGLSSARGNGVLSLEAGGGRVFHTGKPIANLFVADPKVAEAPPASPNSVFVFGVGPGRTTVAALDDAGNVIAQYDVSVRPSGFGADEGTAVIRKAFPGSETRLTATPDGLTATGVVANPLQAERVASSARSFLTGTGQRVDNQTTVSSAVQVTLRVRIAEISRTITRQLGINWQVLSTIGRFGISAALTDGLSVGSNLPNQIRGTFTDGKTTINTVLDLLAEDQLITILAEPNLTTRSGETASFLAGGEFPVPVSASNGVISIQYKQYGVSLAFVPTILTDGRISLRVRPEVSELTQQGAISIPIATSIFGTSSITIPAVTVRRADTTVELGSGQSLAIAGLLSGKNNFDTRGLPYLGELPVIGALFKSDLFVKNKTELVIVVTPYVVNPVSTPGALRTPTDDFVPAGDFDRILLLRHRARGTGPGKVPYADTSPASAPVALNVANGGTKTTAAGFILP